jgi:RHS repeat-associated protein
MDGLQDEKSQYTYDHSNRLTRDWRFQGGNPYDHEYTYDKNNNRTSIKRNGTTINYTINNTTDQFTSGDNFAVTNYDGDGNPTQLNRPGGAYVQFFYDALGRVRRTYNGSSNFNFRYNSDGQRIERWGVVGKYRYAYDGSSIIAESHDNLDDIERYFIPGVGYYDIDTNQNFYYWNNALGSQIALTNSSGTIISRTEYDAYGNEVIVNGSLGRSDFRFAGSHGYVSDHELTGLDLLGLRYYIPQLGRFLTRDPIV